MHAEVDYDRAWLRLKAAIAEKRSHGADGLYALMARIEVECMKPVRAPAHDGPLGPEDADASSGRMPETANPLAAEEAADGNRAEDQRVPTGAG